MTVELDKLFDVDFDTLAPQFQTEVDLPEIVKGRVLHIDGDFLAYQVSADDTKSFDDMKHNHDVAVETLRLLAGAEKAVSHLTSSVGCKGKRFEIALQKEYQANRKGKEKPKYLYLIKDWMEKHRGAINHVNQEADDGLAQANQAAIDAGTPELSVIVSKDKDLQMVRGYHLDWDDGTIEIVDGFGYVELDRSKSSPKIRGKGTAYFWAQMLTGDAADNIAGLPQLPGYVLNWAKPTAESKKAQAVLTNPSSTEAQKTKARQVLIDRKPGACGAVTAYSLMENIKSDSQALTAIQSLYVWYGDNIGFFHHATGEPLSALDVFHSEAKLLWMRRKNHEDDVLHFFDEVLNVAV